jgi:hypothetical protein
MSFNQSITFITEITNTIIVVLVIAILFEILSLFPSKKKNTADCETMTEPEQNNSQIKLVNLDNLITSTTQKTTLNTNTPTVFRVYDRYAEYRENRYSNNQQKQNMYYQDARDEVDVDVDNVDVETRYNRQIARSRSRSPYSPNNTSAYYRSRL